MKNILMAVAVFALFSMFGVNGYCQDSNQDDSAISQTESQMGSSIDSEISSEQSQAQTEVQGVDTSMQTGEKGSE